MELNDLKAFSLMASFHCTEGTTQVAQEDELSTFLPSCGPRCDHWYNSAITVREVANCFLIESEASLHRQEFMSGALNMLKARGWGDHRT